MSSILKKMHVQEYLYDFDEDGGLVSTIDLSAKEGFAPLPQGALVENVSLKVITAVVGSTSSMAAGNTTDPNGYMEAIAEATLVDEFVSRVGQQAGALMWDDTNDHMLTFLVNSDDDAVFSIDITGNALTAGKVLFWVNYYSPSED